MSHMDSAEIFLKVSTEAYRPGSLSIKDFERYLSTFRSTTEPDDAVHVLLLVIHKVVTLPDYHTYMASAIVGM